MDTRFTLASSLAQFLRRNGDKVINGSCKLSLTTSALCLLNSLFAEKDQYTNSADSAISEIAEDVKFLYDFMKKTSYLKLFHGNQTLRGGVDLSHFSNLTVLELRKIPAHLIFGLNAISFQLRALICSRSICLLKELFTSCIQEDTTDVWSELKELNVSYNYLENLDNSLKCLPNVEILDLSHNNIRNTDDIQILRNLSFLNLSYNQLEHLPVLNTISCRFLLKLYVRNNNLEDLDGIECVFNLEELDVGYNLLSEYHVLNPLDKLKSLKMLNLEGNPIFFHKRHFMLVANYLHPNVLIRGLRLNGRYFSVPRNMLPSASNTNVPDASCRHQTSINTVVGDMQNMNHPPRINPVNHLLQNATLTPVMSDKSSCDENSASSYTSQSGAEQMPLLKKNTGKKHRKSNAKALRKSREVSINEPEQLNNEVLSSPKHKETVIPSHLKTKESLEARRRERGESWLIPDNSFQKLIVTPPKVPFNTPVVNDTLTQKISQPSFSSELQNQLNCRNFDLVETDSNSQSSSPLIKEMTEVLDIKGGTTVTLEGDRTRHVSKGSDIEILDLNLKKDNASFVQDNPSKDDLSDCDVYGHHSSSDEQNNEHMEESGSEEESEDSIFFVERGDNLNKETLSVKIGAKYAKEKDVLSGKLVDKLDLSTLLSVSTVTKDDDGQRSEVHLAFDTVKSSRQRRIYVLDDPDSAKAMSKILQPFADATTLKEATIGALECLKCNSQFSKQVAHRKVLKTKKPLSGKEFLSSSYDSSKGYIQETDACPNCGNHILVEMESIPLPTVATAPHLPLNQLTASFKTSSENSDNISVNSTSSDGLLSTLLSSIKISPMIRRKTVSYFSQPSQGKTEPVPRESLTTDLCENETPKTHGLDKQISRNSSDVTILSNPSQSSIAVIPEPVCDNNLNTIIERTSQLSMSPPVSRNSTLNNSDKSEESHNILKSQYSGIQFNANENEIPRISNGEDHDFYSLTESFTNEKQPVGNEVTSSGSEAYLSPYKGAGPKSVSAESELDEASQIMLILGEKKKVNYDMFTELDHRLKLHVEINIFGDDEHLNACLQTAIVPLSTGEEIDGVFILSSKKVYVIKFLPLYSLSLEQSKSLERMVKVIYSGPLNQIKQIKSILGNQGLTIACGPSTHVYTLVIRDADICNSFSSLISDLIQEHISDFGPVEFLSSTEETMQQISDAILASHIGSDKKPEILLHLFAFWNAQNDEKDPVHPFCIIVTQEDIFTSKILYKKQDSCSDLLKLCIYYYNAVGHQKISDLISVKLRKDLLSANLTFLNESSETENNGLNTWIIGMKTKSALFSFINALKNPWMEIFGIPLPLSLESD